MNKQLFTILILITSYYNIFSQKTIEMEYNNGVYLIPCKVNNVPMKFIFDTGASNVSISLTEAKFLLKQGALKDEDLLGTVKYQIANGEVQEGTKIILKEINIGGVILKDVEAGIVHQENAPLLLGQSAISKLGKIRLDGNKLIIESKSSDVKQFYFTFLNIDITKTFDDYNFNFKLKEMPIDSNGIIDLSFSLDMLTTIENHFLQDFYFENQIAKFKKNGLLYAVILSKKSKDIDAEFDRLSERIVSIYGNCTEYGKVSKIWKKRYFDISIIKDDNDYLRLMLLIERNETIVKKELREELIDIINSYYEFNDKNKKEIVRFSRSNENNLAIFIQYNINTDKNNFMKSKEQEEWIKYFCMKSVSFFLDNVETNKTFVNILEYDNIELNIELTFYGTRREKIIKHIYKKDILELKVPFTDGELMNIIK